MKTFVVMGLLAVATLVYAQEACVEEKLANQKLLKQLAEYQMNNGLAVVKSSSAEIKRLEGIVAQQQQQQPAPPPPPPAATPEVQAGSSSDAPQ